MQSAVVVVTFFVCDVWPEIPHVVIIGLLAHVITDNLLRQQSSLGVQASDVVLLFLLLFHPRLGRLSGHPLSQLLLLPTVHLVRLHLLLPPLWVECEAGRS